MVTVVGFADMIPQEIIYKIIEAGIAAPSGDNLQPWRFRWDGENNIDIDKSLYNIFYRGQKFASLITAYPYISKHGVNHRSLRKRVEGLSNALFPFKD